ncbi:MAG: dipeptide ABC transporter ATP-binding protein [Euzebya sp.]
MIVGQAVREQVNSVSDPALLKVRGLSITSRLGGRRRTIVRDVDLTLGTGETIGIVGESGSGKSMTARALLGLLPAGLSATGVVQYGKDNLLDLPERRLRQVRGGEIGLVLQDPYTMLNPLLRCGIHLEEGLRADRSGQRVSGGHHAQALERLNEVGISDPRVAVRFPFQLSGGMRQRVGIAASLARDPAILIADEPTTAVDVTTQRDILILLKSLQAKRGMGLVLITHDLRVAFSMCDRVYVLYAGSLLEIASATALEAEPLHPYTLGLLLSEPPGDRRVPVLAGIKGSVPDPDSVATCCAFAPRCTWAAKACHDGSPPLQEVEPGRFTNCVRLDDIRPEMAGLRHVSEQPVKIIAPPDDQQLVQVRDLNKIYQAGAGKAAVREVQALKDVNLTVGEGEGVGLVGESGSGKTTLGRCLVGLETPNSGQIDIAGISAVDYLALDTTDRTRLRRTVQIIFQDPYSSLNPARTVGFTLKQALQVGRGRHESSSSHVGELLERVGLSASYATRKPIALSGGERQRVAIARALAVRPRLIVCDEPVSALDVSVQAQILNLFKELRQDLGVAYLFITHDLAVVRQVVERIYVLYQGEVVESGPIDQVLDNPSHPYTERLVASIPRSDADWLSGADPLA